EAIAHLDEAEALLGNADNQMKAQFYALRGTALLGKAGTDAAKLKSAANAFATALSTDPNIESQISTQLQNLRAALINGAVADQNSQQYDKATEKLYLSYTVSKDPSDLYFAASNAVNGKDYETALKHYQSLLDMGYTGETEEFVATD